MLMGIAGAIVQLLMLLAGVLLALLIFVGAMFLVQWAVGVAIASMRSRRAARREQDSQRAAR